MEFGTGSGYLEKALMKGNEGLTMVLTEACCLFARG